jgi:hypothetical protein
MCTKLSNTEKFINKAIKIHNNKYSYEKVDYKKSGEKVQIICKIHGVFNQTPENHLYGYGCKVCGTESSITKQRTSLLNFIVNAKKLHKDKYNYDLVEYNGCKNKVKIKCNKHNITFFQTPDLHLRGSGCTLCGKEIVSNKLKPDLQNFIDNCNIIHNNKYNYSLVNYRNAKTKIKIICEIHGEFEQTPDVHLKGSGCKKCSNNSRTKLLTSNTNAFIEKSKFIHKNKYDYKLVDYKDSKSNVTIICPIHGNFKQLPTIHLRGCGCNDCGNDRVSTHNKQNPIRFGYEFWVNEGLKSKNFDNFKVYVVHCWNNQESFYKIGKSFRTLKKRFKDIPYNYEIIEEIIDNGYIICKLEHLLQRSHKEFKYLPKIKFGGMYECFSKIDLELVSSNL